MSESTALVPTIGNYLNAGNVRKFLETMLKERTGSFITSLVSMQNLNKNLQGCEPNSLMMCGLKAVSLGLPLDPNLGFAYPVPYTTKKKVGEEWIEVKEAQFQMGYKGIVQLAQRSEQYATINVIDIRAGELILWDELEEKLEWCKITPEEKRLQQPIIGYAGMFRLNNGFKKIVYWSKEQVLKHARRFSKTYNKESDRFASYNKYKKEWISSPWESDFDAMAKKTVLKDMVGKWGPVSVDRPELQEAMRADQAVIKLDEASGQEEILYLDNPINDIVEGEIVSEKYEEPETGTMEREFKKKQQTLEDAANAGTNKG